MTGNHLLRQSQHNGCFDCTISMKHMALPPVFIDDAEDPQFAASLSVVRNEVPCQYVILVFGLLRQTCRQAATALAWLRINVGIKTVRGSELNRYAWNED